MKLDRLVSLAILSVCLLMSARLVRDLFTPVGAAASIPSLTSSVPARNVHVAKEGEAIQDTSDLDLKSAQRTLLLVTASTCHFCTASMPFYKRMMGVARQQHVRVVGVTREDPGTNQKYLVSYGVSVDRVVAAEANKIGVMGTPTLLLLDVKGRILHVWSGQLESSREAQVLGALGAP